MPLILIGVIFVIGLFLYYMLSTSGSSDKPEKQGAPKRKKPSDNLRQEENVIYLSDDIDQLKRNHNIGDK